MTNDTLQELSLKEIHQRLRDGSLKSRELTESAIAAYREDLGAYRDFRKDDAIEHANLADQAFRCGTDLGPLQGVPVSVKDLYGLSGTQTFAGSPKALPESFEKEGPVVSSLRRQHSVFTGKTHTVEFAFGGLGVNTHWGTPRNPWDAETHRVPGGSSCGAGVSLQEGTAWIALGSDTAGSVRVPASMTGCVGLKTSYGRWSLEGIFPLSPTLDTAGILTRSAEDALIGFAAIDPEHQGKLAELMKDAESLDPASVRISTRDMTLWQDCESGIAETVEDALKELNRGGVRLVESTTPETRQALEIFNMGSVPGIEIKEFIQSELPAWLETTDPVVGTRIKSSSSVDAGEYLRRLRVLKKLSASVQRHFEDVDLIASPTVPITPPLLADVCEVEGYAPRNMASLRNTTVGNLLGLCGITLPVGLDASGMPVGLQLLAKHGNDAKLLTIACRLEKILGTPRQRLGLAPCLK